MWLKRVKGFIRNSDSIFYYWGVSFKNPNYDITWKNIRRCLIRKNSFKTKWNHSTIPLKIVKIIFFKYQIFTRSHGTHILYYIKQRDLYNKISYISHGFDLNVTQSGY